MRRDYQEFVSQGASIIVTGPDDARAFRDYWLKEKLIFTGVPDPTRVVAKLYSQEFKILKLGLMPALFIIDRNGLIRFSHRGRSMSDIPENKTVLELLQRINREAENTVR